MATNDIDVMLQYDTNKQFLRIRGIKFWINYTQWNCFTVYKPSVQLIILLINNAREK